MKSGLRRLLCLFHSLVFRTEHALSVPVTVWLRGMTPIERFIYQFNMAVGLRATRPEISRALFSSLLHAGDTQAFPQPWYTGRQARIYYYLGLLAADDSEKIAHFTACLNLMPEHYMAKEMLYTMQQHGSTP